MADQVDMQEVLGSIPKKQEWLQEFSKGDRGGGDLIVLFAA